MKILDCTLRDGGHAVGFDWPVLMAREYVQTIGNVADVIELGYWGQTSKSKNMFYNLDMQRLEVFATGEITAQRSIMVDYHYCSHDYADYPKEGNGIVDMIRVCSRKQDLKDAITWANGLKEATGLLVSFNVFNFSNYRREELMVLPSLLRRLNTDFLYFADTHGALDLGDMDGSWQREFYDVTATMSSRMDIGLHFHDHLGKAMTNYAVAGKYNAGIVDSTLFGIGKGAGNLRTEQVVNKKHLPQVLTFISKWDDYLRRPFNPYYMLTAKHSVCEAYAVEAHEKGVELQLFDNFCKLLTTEQRDVYQKGLVCGV